MHLTNEDIYKALTNDPMTADELAIELGYIGDRRYLRVKLTKLGGVHFVEQKTRQARFHGIHIFYTDESTPESLRASIDRIVKAGSVCKHMGET